MSRPNQAVLVQAQADHDLLIEIRTKLEGLITSHQANAASTATTLAAKADRSEVDALRTRVDEIDRGTPSNVEMMDVKKTLKETADTTKRLERLMWMVAGGVIVLQLLLKYIVPSVQIIPKP